MSDLHPEKPGYRARLTRRWKSEGRLEEVDEFRRRVAAECVGRGVKKADAREHAWEEAIRVYPPLSDEELEAIRAEEASEEEEVVEVKRLGPQAGKARGGGRAVKSRVPKSWGEIPERASYSAEVEWVYQNYYDARDVREDGGVSLKLARCNTPAPSRGAIGLLEWAIDNRTSFFKDVLPRAKAKGDDEDTEGIRREKKALGEIEGILGQMGQVEVVGLVRDLLGLAINVDDLDGEEVLIVKKAEKFLETV